MADGVLYMLQGRKHAVQLAVSIHSLRKHYDGPICIACGDNVACEYVEFIQADSRLHPLKVVKWNASTRKTAGRSGAAYANKCHMNELTPFDRTIFLDADTVVANPLDDLWTEDNEVRLTWFADWVTTGPIIGWRIKGWKDICPREYEYMSQHPCPAINTGVIGFSKKCDRFMNHWRETTDKNVCFICDEIAAQLIFVRHPHLVLSDRWNFSPQHSNPVDKQGREKKIRVIHYHGKQHCKPEKSDGHKTWIPLYEECVNQNIASINDWTPAGDRRLKRFLNDRVCA